MTAGSPAYGLWSLVLINTAFFTFFALSFSGLQIRKDWRTLGPYTAFIAALFTEMYGFPLTIYLLSGWLAKVVPGVDLLSHDAGHLWFSVLGMKGDPHFGAIHILSSAFIVGGFWLLAASWHKLYQAQRLGRVATAGPYARIRHPQYVAFVVVMFGFLLQWPTLPTLVMFPILVWIYARLARREERDSLVRFGRAYADYMEKVPAFLPSFSPADAQIDRST